MDQDLPAHIQRQVEEAEAIEAAIAAEQAARETPTDTQPVEAPVEAPVAETVPEPQVKALPDAEEETWHSRFNTLQGKFNAEVPRLYEQLRESNKAIADLRAELDRKNQQPEPVQVAQTVTSEDEEAFGSDLIAVMKKVAKQEAAEAAKQAEALTRTVDRKVDAVLKDQEVTAGEKFMGAIAKAVPDWEVVNADPKWLDWLGEYSPETGAPRQAALDAATDSLDSNRAIALFKLFKSLQPAPVAAPDKTQQELQSQVAPAKTAAPTSNPSPDRIWTGADYERAYDVRLINTMSESEVTELQAEAERAYNEGRIRW